jgi:hypothetical protein
MISGMKSSVLFARRSQHKLRVMGKVRACLKLRFRLSEIGGSLQGSWTMKRLAFAIGILALGVSASTAARADYAVVMFKDGYCRVWQNSGATPTQPGWKYHWVGLRSWDFAMTKKHYAIRHGWCKEFR